MTLALDPTDWQIRLALARTLMEGGGSVGDVPALLGAGQPGPDLAPRPLALALWAGSRRDFGAAVAEGRRAAELDRDDPDALAVLASALEASSQPQAAIDAWREVLRIQPQDRASHEALAALYRRTGDAAAEAFHREYVARLSR
jgi:Flp pilus assembly protein TadD